MVGGGVCVSDGLESGLDVDHVFHFGEGRREWLIECASDMAELTFFGP